MHIGLIKGGTMNKEEIEESKKCLEETIQNCYAEKKAIKLNNLRKYIQQLETKVKEQEESRQAAIDKLKDEIELINKCYEELFTNVSGIKVIDITGLSKKEREEVINKRNCLLIQKHCYKKFLNMLEGEKK